MLSNHHHVSFTLTYALLGLLCHVHCGSNHIFRSVEHMKPLVDMEKELLSLARTYLKDQKRKLAELDPFAGSVQEAMQLSEIEHGVKYLGNPINCYLMIKRFTSGWKELPPRLDLDTTTLNKVNQVLDQNEQFMPLQDDLSNAISAMSRLVDDYGMSVTDIVQGKIDGVIGPLYQLTAHDCVAMAELCKASLKYKRMKEWLVEADRLISDHSLTHRHGNTTQDIVHGHLSWLNQMTESKESPDSQAAKTTYHKKLCRNTVNHVKGYKNINNLRSYYWLGAGQQFRLKPFRITQLHDQPEIFLIRDIVTPLQIGKLKQISSPRLRVSSSTHPDNQVAKVMLLKPELDGDQNISKNLNSAFEAATGLSMETSDSIEVKNYGLGSEYEDHHDHDGPESGIGNSFHGNRIATLQLYLSDVQRGGETVFPAVGVKVAPSPGTALLWFNAHRNGKRFAKAVHSSCPVVAGSKWVATKWILNGGNEFRRPCGLKKKD